MKKQWHPLFVHLLRPRIEGYYEVQTDVPVGDKPRQADIVLLRRTGTAPPPFRGLWRHLTRENVLEFKGPTVVPRVRDIDLLVELGPGIDRRLQAERKKQGRELLAPQEVSFWYVANRLGRRFLRELKEMLGNLGACGPGLWQCRLLGRTLFFVSSVDLPVDEDSLPLHIICQEPPAKERAVARYVVEQPALQKWYGPWLATLHSETWRELRAMGKVANRGPEIDLRPLVKYLGMDQVIRQLGLKQVIEEAGLKQVIEEVGLKQVIEEVGLKQVIQEVGPKRVIDEMGLDWLIANLSPAQRRELRRRLQ